MEKYKVAVVGCGGIGSYLVKFLFDLQEKNQLESVEEIDLYDSDTVDFKNLPYQDFEEVDVTDHKAENLAERYSMVGIVEKVETPEILDKYDIIIAAVDNSKFRKLLYEWAENNPDKYWIDLRSEGRTVAYYTKNKKNTLKSMLGTLAETPEEGTSCQLAFELENNIIQQGNKIIASIGSQLLLNYLRMEFNAPTFMARI